MHETGTFCIWLEIKMQLNKYFGPISFSISTVFRTSRCVIYNIWTGSFVKPLWGFMFILFVRFKDFVIVFLPHDWFSSHVTKSFKKFKERLILKIIRIENVPSLEIFLSFCWIGFTELTELIISMRMDRIFKF